MPRTYTDDERTAALNLYEAEGPTAVQRKLGIPKSTVMQWARRTGRRTVRTARTREATEARAVDLKLRRQMLAENLLTDAESLRGQIWKPALYFEWGGKDHDYAEKEVAEPTPTDKLKLMQATTTAAGEMRKLLEFDSDDGASAAKSMLRGLAEQLGLGDA